MTRRLLLLAALLLPAAACDAPRYAREDYFEILPQAVAYMAEDARANGLPQPPQGPLWVDLVSFAQGGNWLTRSGIDTADVRAGLAGIDFRAARMEQGSGLLCEDVGVGGCWVQEYGTYLRMHVVQRNGREVIPIVASYTTDRRSFPTQFCKRVWRLYFAPEGDGWAMVRRDSVEFTCPTAATPEG